MSSINLTRAAAAQRAELLTVDNYAVTLELADNSGNPRTGTFTSSTTVTFSSSVIGAHTFIDVRDAKLTSATLNGVDLNLADFDHEQGLQLENLQAENTLTVAGEFTFSSTGEGLHQFTDSADGEIYLYSQFQTADAKRVFACFDQPDLKATYDFTITAPASWQVVSATTATITQQESSAVTHTFSRSKPLSTYLVSVIAGPYAVWEDNYEDEHGVIPLRILTRASLAQFTDHERIFTETKQGFGFYHRNFGMPYPFGKYDQIFVPEFNAGAMENAGAVTFLEDYIFRSKVTGYLYERRAETILHEMAHMWFGDLVTMRWWDDLWLNESFATYASVLAQVDATEYKDSWTTFATVEKAWAYRQDQLSSTHPIAADMVDLAAVEVNFDGITYAKGASVLKQLVAYVGVESFMQGLRQYFADYAYGTAEFSDLVSAITTSSGRDLSQWADQWLRTTGMNTLGVDISEDGGVINRLAVTQSGAEPGAGELRAHAIAVGFYNTNEQGELVRTHQERLDISTASTEIAACTGMQRPELILVNDDDLTYCALTFDEVSLQTALTKVHTISDSLARAMVWSTLWEMVRSGELDAAKFVHVVCGALTQETNISVLQKLLAQCHTSLMKYVNPRWAEDTGWSLYTTALYRYAVAAEAGSDHQLAAVNALAVAKLTTQQATVFADIASGGESSLIPGLVVDTDLRWSALIAAVSHGLMNSEDIEKLLSQDATDSGKRRAATARAAIPSIHAKQQAVDMVTDCSEQAASNAIIRATLLGLYRAGHEEYVQPLGEQFPQLMAKVWKERPGDTAYTLTTGLFPSWDVSEDNVEKFSAYLADTSLPSGLTRLATECLDDVKRALHARAVSGKS